MKRVRWFSAKWPISMRSLASRMKALAFTKDSFDGFILHKLREGYIEGAYAKKLSYQETITDPFGNEESYERIAYHQVNFSLFSDFPHIEFIDAPRNVQSFTNKLLELNNFALTISPLLVDPLAWAASFEKSLDREIRIHSLQISGLEFEKGVNAKILLQGDKDIRNTLSTITRNKPYDLEKALIRAPLDGKDISILLINNGSAKFPEDYEDVLLPILKKSLPQSTST
jgi:hypothetical protein